MGDITKNDLGTLGQLSVGSGSLGLSQEYRDFLCEEIENNISDAEGEEHKYDDKAWTGDVNGFEKYHQDSRYDDFFSPLSTAIFHYCMDIGVNHEMFNFEVVRCWGTKTKSGENISKHTHDYAHLSVVYYPKVPEACGELILSVQNPQNELVPGMFTAESYQMGALSYNTQESLNILGYEPKDDMYVMFPAKTQHQTNCSSSHLPRYSIAADIIMTLKDCHKVEGLLPCKSSWKNLNA